MSEKNITCERNSYIYNYSECYKGCASFRPRNRWSWSKTGANWKRQVLRAWNTEAVVWRCSVKKLFLKISQNSQENTCARVSFNEVASLRPATSLKETLAQVFSCEFFQISKNTYLHRTPLVAASDHIEIKWNK